MNSAVMPDALDSSMLALTGLDKQFGAMKVTDQVSLSLNANDALGIIGPNGAGKTTLFNLISGALKADTGSIHFLNMDVTRTNSAKRCRMGVGRTFQIPQPFEGMSVFENCLVSALYSNDASQSDAEAASWQAICDCGLTEKVNEMAGQLTLLDRKRLELARALAGKPKLLLLDEIAGGLTESECHDLVALIQRVHRSGVAIIWIEHVVHALMSVVNKLVVLDQGAIVSSGEPEEVMNSDIVRSIYLGINVDE